MGEHRGHDLPERDAWICLASATGVADEYQGLLVAHFGGAAQVLARAADGSLRRWANRRRPETSRPYLPARVVAAIEQVAGERAAKLDAIRRSGLWSLTPLDTGYPQRLRDLDPPPAVIHGWGEPAALSGKRAVALVGTRRPTSAGRSMAARVARRLAECGATVVSGLAIGIDGAGHAATVESGGQTVGVIGAGHGSPGPRAHGQLRERIVAGGGALISEHHPEVRASKGTYPRRNRVIAALADAVLVIEAPARSGALITARHGLEMGRPVLVMPGRPGDWSTAGSLALLRETPARPLVGLDELVADLGYVHRDGPTSQLSARLTPADALALLGPSERAVAEEICRQPANLDALVVSTGLPPATVSGAVTLLLMRGWIQAVGPAYLPAGALVG